MTFPGDLDKMRKRGKLSCLPARAKVPYTAPPSAGPRCLRVVRQIGGPAEFIGRRDHIALALYDRSVIFSLLAGAGRPRFTRCPSGNVFENAFGR